MFNARRNPLLSWFDHQPPPKPPGPRLPTSTLCGVELISLKKVATEGRALVIAANKSDISGVSPGEYAKGVIEQVEALMPDVRAPPVLSVCALDGESVEPPW